MDKQFCGTYTRSIFKAHKKGLINPIALGYKSSKVANSYSRVNNFGFTEPDVSSPLSKKQSSPKPYNELFQSRQPLHVLFIYDKF
jgi:hypothetical protein